MRVRTGGCTGNYLDLPMSRIVSKSHAYYPSDALHILKTNQEVDNHNVDHLKRLLTPVFYIREIDKKRDFHTGLIDVAI